MNETKQAIRQAAARLFWERGFEGTSPRLIQEAAGAGQGSFYHHFASKAALASDVLDEVSGTMRRRATELLGGDGEPIARLRAYLTEPREGLKGCRLGRLAHEASAGEAVLRGPIQAYFTCVEGLVAAAIDEAVVGGELPAGLDSNAVAAALVATVQGGYVLARALQDPAQLTLACNGARQLLESLVAGAAGRSIGSGG